MRPDKTTASEIFNARACVRACVRTGRAADLEHQSGDADDVGTRSEVEREFVSVVNLMDVVVDRRTGHLRLYRHDRASLITTSKQGAYQRFTHTHTHPFNGRFFELPG